MREAQTTSAIRRSPFAIQAPVAPYRAPWWLPGGHAQTIYAAVLARRARVAYRLVLDDYRGGDAIQLVVEHLEAGGDAQGYR
jgi:predicted alpha/beta-fold hydrolase